MDVTAPFVHSASTACNVYLCDTPIHELHCSNHPRDVFQFVINIGVKFREIPRSTSNSLLALYTGPTLQGRRGAFPRMQPEQSQ
jgi:hypothetical protein